MNTQNKDQWIAFTDGASRGNPGLAGCGVFIRSPEGKEHRLKKFIGTKTNNQAEYEAMLLCLEKLIKLEAKTVLLKADSELMVKQLQGAYRVKNANIIPLFQKAQQMLSRFQKISFVHVPRNENKEADLLANMAIDEHQTLAT